MAPQRVAGEPADGHGGGEGRVSGSGERGSCAERASEIEGAPIRNGAFAEEEAEGDGRQSEKDGRDAEGLFAVGAGGRFGDESGKYRDDDAGINERGNEEMEADGDAGACDESAESGAGHAADAEHGMKAGHQGLVLGALDQYALRIHGDIHGAGGQPENGERNSESDGGGGQGRQNQREAKPEGRDGGQRARAVVVDDPAGKRHRNHGAGGDAEQGESQAARAELERGLDGRDAGHPGGEDGAVDEEGRQDREPGVHSKLTNEDTKCANDS